MYKNVSAEELLSAIDSWHPVWFAVEQSTLTVDLCVNYRLTDGKVLFLKFFSTDAQELSRVANEVAQKAKQNWIKALDKMSGNLDEQIEDSSQTEKVIASVQWVEGQKYKITNDEPKIYICVSSCDEEVYIKEILPPSRYYLEALNNDRELRDIVNGDTEVELMD